MQARRARIEEQVRLLETGVRRHVGNEDGKWFRWVVILPPATKIAQAEITSPFPITRRSNNPFAGVRHRS